MHLDELIAELGKSSGKGECAHRKERYWEMYEAVGSCVGMLLNAMENEKKERMQLEARILKLEAERSRQK